MGEELSTPQFLLGCPIKGEGVQPRCLQGTEIQLLIRTAGLSRRTSNDQTQPSQKRGLQRLSISGALSVCLHGKEAYCLQGTNQGACSTQSRVTILQDERTPWSVTPRVERAPKHEGPAKGRDRDQGDSSLALKLLLQGRENRPHSRSQ
jgi:hypothetical protein